MTIDEFMERLSALGLEWRKDWAGVRSGSGLDKHCPISAVTGDPHDFHDPRYGGQKLGLSLEDTEAIVSAADHPYRGYLGQRLMEVCGLK